MRRATAVTRSTCGAPRSRWSGGWVELISLAPHTVAGSVQGQDLEVRRGDLTAVLHELVRDDAELIFGTWIDSVEQSGHGADFTMPNTFGLSRELVLWNTPGRAAALYAVGDDDELHAFLNFHRPEPPGALLRDPDAQRDLVASVYSDAGWEVPGIVAAMRDADDLFCDTAGQIRMPRWSAGRVALVGDAAYAPSFLTGQGSSLALVGAYLLADALAGDGDHTAALAAYDRGLRPFVAMNQALVGTGAATLFPTTADDLARRNARLRDLAALPSATARPAHSALVLPEPTAPPAHLRGAYGPDRSGRR
ncbi:hypothetical protein [Jidongwangia harbinensis]|uniref:hypothetical protein n=1 Tax=Jidongwangia harbinensis TaxID=2878561 RepID=UPI001CD95C12|nr:hypothetical protein [Jidongwangia harbinensis]MCA2211422.1 hypothetical protein [Jidongwangia harbinensis]